MSIQTLANSSHNSAPSLQPYAPSETAVVHSAGEHFQTALHYPGVNSFETAGDYQAVMINGREPLLSAAELEKQVSGRGEMLGDLMAVVHEPIPNHIDMQKQATPGMSNQDIYERDNPLRERGNAASAMYVFQRQGINGPEYTIMGNAAFGRLAAGLPNPEGAILHMHAGSKSVEVGNQDGSWLPSVGYDRAHLQNDPELTRVHRTVSRRQARFTFDDRGNFYYQEADTRKNPATIEVKKTEDEVLLDEALVYQTKKVDRDLSEERSRQESELVKGDFTHQPLSTEDRITPEDLLVRKMPTSTYKGKLVGEDAKRKRRTGFLGKVANKIIRTASAENVESAPAPEADPEIIRMEGWFRDMTITGERQPIKDGATTTKRWRFPWGKEMARLTLPGRDKPGDLPVESDPEITLPFERVYTKDAKESQYRRMIHIFDARTDPGDPPHYIVASRDALLKIAATPPLFRGVVAKLSRDVHHIYEGQRLEVGAKDSRWLPTGLRRYEKKLQNSAPGRHHSRPVISGEQSMFYVGEDHQLHVRSEGYNPDVLVAHPSDAEIRQWGKEAAYRQELESRRAKGQRTKDQYMSVAPTEPIQTQNLAYTPRHAADTQTRVGV